MALDITPSVVKKTTRRRLSRYGCRNCKLRKFKCDETRPGCERCRTYGVICNFGYNVPDLQPLHQIQVTQEISTRSQVRLALPRAIFSHTVWSSDKSSFLNLDRQDQELFYRFRCRTVHSLGDTTLVSIYENKIFRDCFTYPALMHGILAMAAAHDRYQGAQPTPRRPIREVYHSSQCTVLFRESLSQPIEENRKDAIWATAVTLASLAFASINVSSFEQAWPLRPSDSSDLQWLRLKANDKALWHLANPMRSGSAFRDVAEIFTYNHEPLPAKGIDGVSVELAKLCGLDDSSTLESDHYFGFVHALSRLLQLPNGEATLGQIFTAVSAIPKVLRARLEEKDPVALLLLYLWYTRARECRWWVDLRARYELPAIRAYLQRYHWDIAIVQSILLTESE